MLGPKAKVVRGPPRENRLSVCQLLLHCTALSLASYLTLGRIFNLSDLQSHNL